MSGQTTAVTLASRRTLLTQRRSHRLAKTRFQSDTAPSNATNSIQAKNVLIIGGTGVTGKSAVSGLLLANAGQPTQLQLTAMTRRPAAALRSLSLPTVAGDLDNPRTVVQALRGVDILYCHALSSDASQADPAEVRRAKHVAEAAAASGVQLVVYNSGAGGGNRHTDQKHQVEDILSASGVPLVALRATMFMEEFWKQYTRPSIITKARFPFSLPPDKKLQLLAARDMGLVAGRIMHRPDQWQGKVIELAGDELTPVEMCAAFTKAQPAGGPTPVRHMHVPLFLIWLLNKDLYEISKFLTDKGYSADVARLHEQFPGMLTFEDFLSITNWQDGTHTYEQGVEYKA